MVWWLLIIDALQEGAICNNTMLLFRHWKLKTHYQLEKKGAHIPTFPLIACPFSRNKHKRFLVAQLSIQFTNSISLNKNN